MLHQLSAGTSDFVTIWDLLVISASASADPYIFRVISYQCPAQCLLNLVLSIDATHDTSGFVRGTQVGSEKYFNRRAGTCGRAKDPPFGDGYTPFNYTSRDGGRQTGGILGGARSFRPSRRQFGRKYRKNGNLPVLADPSRSLHARH